MPPSNNQPAIVLVRPQLGENIGKAARAMLNFGLTDLRLVAPRDGWPNPSAGPAAAGADLVLERARIYDSLADAVADCAHVYATTVRKRGVTKPVTITGEFGGIATDPYGNVKAAASGSTVINRHDFGVSWNSPLEKGGVAVGAEVAITIDAEAIRD